VRVSLRNLNNLTLSFAGKIAIVSGYVTGDRLEVSLLGVVRRCRNVERASAIRAGLAKNFKASSLLNNARCRRRGKLREKQVRGNGVEEDKGSALAMLLTTSSVVWASGVSAGTSEYVGS